MVFHFNITKINLRFWRFYILIYLKALSIKKKRPNRSYYTKIISKDSVIQAIEYINVESGKEVVKAKLSFIYKNGFLKILGFLQLVGINEKGGEFKNVNSGKMFTMEIGKRHSLGKALIVNYEGFNHLVEPNQNFMNYKVLVKDQKVVFVKNSKEVPIDSSFIELDELND